MKFINIQRNYILLMFAVFICTTFSSADTFISDLQLSTPRISSDYSFSSILNFSSIRVSTNNLTSQVANYIRYTNIFASPNNTDLFEIRGESYSPYDSVKASTYGIRNVVSRLSTYDRNDVAPFYAVWHDYAGSEGGNYWAYIVEHPCNATFVDCTDYNSTSGYGQKQGFVLRILELQRGNNKIGMALRNEDPNNNSAAIGLAFKGDWIRGISANNYGDSSYLTAFIDAMGERILRPKLTNATSDTDLNMLGNSIINLSSLSLENGLLEGVTSLYQISRENLLFSYSFDNASIINSSLVLDSSFNLYNANSINSVSYSSSFNNGSSLYFNGVNSRLVLPNNVFKNGTNAMCISFWSKIDNLGVGNIMRNGDAVYLSTTNIKWQIAGSLQAVGQFFGNSEGNWHHIVTCIDQNDGSSAGVQYSYLDGVLAQSRSTDVGSLTFSPFTTIGSRVDSTEFMEGSLDNFEVFTRLLSPVEIQALYSQRSSPLNPVISPKFGGQIYANLSVSNLNLINSPSECQANTFMTRFTGFNATCLNITSIRNPVTIIASNSSDASLTLQNLGTNARTLTLKDGSGNTVFSSNGIQTQVSRGRFNIAANVSAMTCSSGEAGDIYYNGATKKHYGCNSSTWNALY